MSGKQKGASKVVAVSDDLMQDELRRIIINLVDVIHITIKENERLIDFWTDQKDSLDKLAKLAELRVRRQGLREIQIKFVEIMKSSSNKLIIASIQVSN